MTERFMFINAIVSKLEINFNSGLVGANIFGCAYDLLIRNFFRAFAYAYKLFVEMSGA